MQTSKRKNGKIKRKKSQDTRKQRGGRLKGEGREAGKEKIGEEAKI